MIWKNVQCLNILNVEFGWNVNFGILYEKIS